MQGEPRSVWFLCTMNIVLANRKHVYRQSQVQCIWRFHPLLPRNRPIEQKRWRSEGGKLDHIQAPVFIDLRETLRMKNYTNWVHFKKCFLSEITTLQILLKGGKSARMYFLKWTRQLIFLTRRGVHTKFLLSPFLIVCYTDFIESFALC